MSISAERLVDAIEAGIGEIDDSGGSVCFEARELVEDWGRLWARIAGRETRVLALTVFGQIRHTDYGIKDEVVTRLGPHEQKRPDERT
jgi:hypothetical protein